MRKPCYIAFTGLDARTDIDRACRLAARYPVEFAVLFSPKRQGLEPRYPDDETQSRIWWSPLASGRRGHLAAHLCGAYSRWVTGEAAGILIPVDLGYCRRVQVNCGSPDVTRIATFARDWGVRGIAQCRGPFPADTSIDWLFDRSGGAGVAPESWPRHPGGDRLVGYAGGIGPHNVADVIRQLGADGPYWIDMETHVRTEDWFDLDKVEAVCRHVYGDA